MEIDGVIGAKTRAAIREFQSLFGLPVTGEPDQKLYAKMRESRFDELSRQLIRYSQFDSAPC